MKKLLLMIIAVFCCNMYGDTTTVYVPEHGGTNAKVHAFSFDGTEFTHLETSSFPPGGNYENGPVDITIDEVSGTLFIANEDTTTLTLYDSRNLEFIKNITTSTIDGTGIVFDEQEQRIYMTTRNQNLLYVYDWDRTSKTLSEIDSSPVTLSNIVYACGLALDGSKLYVSQYHYGGSLPFYDTVFEYDISNDFQYVKTHITPHKVVGIACDKEYDYIYGGAYSSGINYLDRHDILDPNYSTSKDIGSVPVGLAVDQDTGYVFATTAGVQWGLSVWDTSNWEDPNSLITSFTTDGNVTLGGLCGICLATNGYKTNNIAVGKSDDITDPNDYVVPGNEFTYTINFDPEGISHSNVVITDHLPREVDFVLADPNTGVYDYINHTVTWDIGSLTPADPNETFYIDVMVNEFAEPLTDISNFITISSNTDWDEDTELTPIGCWEDWDTNTPGVIYVDANVDSNTAHTGTNWTYAYSSINDAINRINRAYDKGIYCGTEIWIANGIYSPGSEYTDTFTIPEDIEVYGGFSGNETARTQRDWVNNKTILRGSSTNNNIVTMNYDTVLDGFIIEDAREAGIFGDDSDFTIANCVIRYNDKYGIKCTDSNVSIETSIIKDNSQYGIYHTGASNSLTLSNSKVFGNSWDGLYCSYSAPTITNCMIFKNGNGGSDYYGVNLANPNSSANLRNNTIAYNKNYGISYSGSNAPDIINSILWGNNNDDTYKIQLPIGCDVTYSCVQDPNTTSSTPDATYHNIHCNPEFAYGDPNEYINLHLSSDSNCIDKGYNTGVGIDELDIDGETRISYGATSSTVDMGADEYVYCSAGVSHEYDFNADGAINLFEFGGLSGEWLTESSDPNWIGIWDLSEDDSVDIDDLTDFLDIWLWKACWYDVTPIAMMETMSSFMMEPMMLEADSYSNEYSYADYVDLENINELPLEGQLYQIGELIEWLESIPNDYPEMMNDIDIDEWNEFLEKLYSEEIRILKELQREEILIKPKKEKKIK